MAAQIPTTPPRGFTASFVESLRPEEGRYEVADRRAPGLRLRVLPKGSKVFRWYCTARGKVVTIGPWALAEQPGHVTLAEARGWLERLKAAHAAGSLEEVEVELAEHLRARARVADPVPSSAVSVSTVAEEFYKRRILPHRKRPETARRILDLDVIPVLGARPVEALTTRECASAIERVVDRGAPVHAGKVLAVVKQLLRFAEARGYRVGNPAGPLDPKDLGVVSNVSDRWLTAEEIPVFWRALDAARAAQVVARPDARTGKTQRYEQTFRPLEPATAAALRLLLLTGARTGELLRAQWADVDLEARTWTIPVANQKLTRDQARKARPFVIPLPPRALELLEDLRELAGESPWVVTSPGASRLEQPPNKRVPARPLDAARPAGAYSDKALARALRRLFKSEALVLPGGEASPHDLRRTMRTHLGKLRIPLHVVERCLNHSLGRIVQTYDVGDYLDERREALERWDAFVARLLEPEQANVAFLTPAAGAA